MSTFLTDEHYRVISRLLSLYSTSYSFQSHYKLIRTLDTSTSVCTSTSSRLQHSLPCHHLISRLLSVGIQKQTSIHHDGGLYFSIMFCSFLLQLRDTSKQQNKRLALFDYCLNLIDSMTMDIQIEILTFDSIQSMLALVRAVICKSLAYESSNLSREYVCLLSVKYFLEITSEQQQQLILTMEGESIEQSNLFEGLLYSISSCHYPKSLFTTPTSKSCLFFTVSLAGDYSIDNLQVIETSQQPFEWIQQTAERIAQKILQYSQLYHGGLVLCQKVIHPSVRVKLKQFGIDTLDRLGRQYTSYFCYLTGCQPIETLAFDTLDERYFGILTEIKRVEICNKIYLQFSNQIRPFHTLLLCANTEQSLLELRECIKASHHTLNNALLAKKALYGGGCSESMQIILLKQKRTNGLNHFAARYLSNTLRTVLRAQYDSHLVIDRIHHHLWSLSDSDETIRETCACGLYLSTSRFRTEWNQLIWHLDDDQFMDDDDEQYKNDSEFLIRQSSPQLLDSIQMRTIALRTAIESAINLHLTSACL